MLRRAAFYRSSLVMIAITTLGSALIGCRSHPTSEEMGRYSVSATSLSENCETFRAVVAHDNIPTKRALTLMKEPPGSRQGLFEEILPGGPFYAESVKGVAETDDVSQELADAPMRHYHISRIKRAKADVVGESSELLKSSLNQTSYKELRGAGTFSLGKSTTFGAYLPAMCRMQIICRTKKADRHLSTPLCRPEW